MSKDIILPRPVNGPYYDGWTLDKWVLKVAEETGEAIMDTMQVGVTAARDELCSELTDVITAATSVLEYVGCNFDERQRYQQKINESNAKRDGGRRFRKDDDA